MTNELIDKIKKIYALVENGSTPGERAAARHQLDKILKRYNLNEQEVIQKGKTYYIRYCTFLEFQLLGFIIHYYMDSMDKCARVDRIWKGGQYHGARAIMIVADYEQFVEIDCSYQYFRRHMKSQYKKVEYKTKNKSKREKYQRTFITQYAIKSQLVKPEYIFQTTATKDSLYLSQTIEGGKYHRQIDNTKFLNQ